MFALLEIVEISGRIVDNKSRKVCLFSAVLIINFEKAKNYASGPESLGIVGGLFSYTDFQQRLLLRIRFKCCSGPLEMQAHVRGL